MRNLSYDSKKKLKLDKKLNLITIFKDIKFIKLLGNIILEDIYYLKKCFIHTNKNRK